VPGTGRDRIGRATLAGQWEERCYVARACTLHGIRGEDLLLRRPELAQVLLPEPQSRTCHRPSSRHAGAIRREIGLWKVFPPFCRLGGHGRDGPLPSRSGWSARERSYPPLERMIAVSRRMRRHVTRRSTLPPDNACRYCRATLKGKFLLYITVDATSPKEFGAEERRISPSARPAPGPSMAEVRGMYFVTLVRFRKKVTRESVVESLRMQALDAKEGLRYHGIYWTLGRYDAVAIFPGQGRSLRDGDTHCPARGRSEEARRVDDRREFRGPEGER
jgi:hypothetical protein